MNSLHSKEYRDLIDKLTKARRDAGFTQVQVADLLGKPQSFVSKVETFQRRIDVLELKKLAKVYKKNPNDFL
ncbi:MAG: helix-turn-helix transcriptional regulator [Candidatus Gracilibacteria bacterium]|jgi:transcriptional regulator with XRE-family HTH domain